MKANIMRKLECDFCGAPLEEGFTKYLMPYKNRTYQRIGYEDYIVEDCEVRLCNNCRERVGENLRLLSYVLRKDKEK